MHSRRLIVIYLQNTNAAFHKVVYRHYSDMGNIYITLWRILSENMYQTLPELT